MPGPRSRREFLAVPAQGLAAALLAGAGRPLGSQDDQLLDDLSHRCFLHFWEQSDPLSKGSAAELPRRCLPPN
jgi:hypothetical protein